MSKEIVELYWREMGSNDFARAAKLLSPEFEYYMPQTGEYLQGREAFVALNTAFPAEGAWQFYLLRIVGEGADIVTEVDITDGSRKDRAITFHRIESGLIRRQVEYWPDPYGAPDWRKEHMTLLEQAPF